MEAKYTKEEYAIAIVKHEDEFLILRFRPDYRYCPKDWDFLTRHIESNAVDNKKLILQALKFYCDMEGRIVRAFSPYSWPDPEYRILWHYYPFLLGVSDKDVRLNPGGKYDKFKWVSKENIVSHQRLDYFENALNNTVWKKAQESGT